MKAFLPFAVSMALFSVFVLLANFTGADEPPAWMAPVLYLLVKIDMRA